MPLISIWKGVQGPVIEGEADTEMLFGQEALWGCGLVGIAFLVGVFYVHIRGEGEGGFLGTDRLTD